MTERPITTITDDIAIIDLNLQALRDNYMSQREEAISQLREQYQAAKKKLDRQRAEYLHIVQDNLKVKNHPNADDRNYGYTFTDFT